MPSNFANPAEVFRSVRRNACDERAFVLTAVGIASETEFDGDAWVVSVEGVARAHALHHLWAYEQERRTRPVIEEPLALQPHAWWGTLVYALLLTAVPLIVSQGWIGRDLYRIGVMNPELIRAGEWWRVFTALTLHWDAAHLLGNLGAGGLLGYSAAQIWGNARAWLLIVFSAALANLLEAASGGSHYVSAGASTAVFAALGLIAAFSWRTRHTHARSMRQRWVPLIAGIAVLAMFGAGDAQAEGSDQTNVLSHALGFGVGVVAGALVAGTRGARWLQRVPAAVAAVLALGAVLTAWALALSTPM